MIAKFLFSYSCPELTEEQEAALRRVIPNLELKEDRKPITYHHYTAELDDIFSLNIPGLRLEVDMDSRVDISMYLRMLGAVERVEKWTREQQVNEKVHVHVPNIGLMQVNEVQVLCDLCTDALQGELNAGWRILAICPQPDQRRPDYILGRTTNGDEG